MPRKERAPAVSQTDPTTWSVPSFTGRGWGYVIRQTAEGWSCTCMAWVMKAAKAKKAHKRAPACKHINAVHAQLAPELAVSA